MEDLAETMGWAGSQVVRGSDLMDFRMLEDLFTFLLVLMGSRDYVRNPYLHAKMSKVSRASAFSSCASAPEVFLGICYRSSCPIVFAETTWN